MTEKLERTIDRSIYVMPMFINFVVENLAEAQRLYAAAGFITLATIPGPDNEPVLVHLRRHKYQDILITQGTSTSGTAFASFAAGTVNLTEVAERLRTQGAKVKGPYDTPWFSTDLACTDPDGNTFVLTAPRPDDQKEAQEWASNHLTGEYDAPKDSLAASTD